ncbi:hypothetical protein MALGJ_41130 [Mycolicibacter algericus]|uniref:Uncharacterized protein n=1 Tax=Mycolicibacter algericus TaxID=1288388 RepID=A0A7I9YFI6_MYCAL|nr:hypothetical protein MALGJ_41130 [Mycolicibacter algericus]
MTTRDERQLADQPPLDGVAAIGDWTVGYVNRHPLASLTTVGEQCVLAVRTVQYFFIDLFSGRFQ